ncbi:MAG: STAS domain-containing protein [Proteobacteria bacterium]|nr:STAS domain-containing protein [Pseudomonadota bacterium]
MEISTDRQDGRLTARVKGRITSNNATEFAEELRAAIGDEDHAVILDLENLSYISSAGIRSILMIATNLSSRKTPFVICSPADPIREVFEISGFDKLIPLHVSHAEALSSIGS